MRSSLGKTASLRNRKKAKPALLLPPTPYRGLILGRMRFKLDVSNLKSFLTPASAVGGEGRAVRFFYFGCF